MKEKTCNFVKKWGWPILVTAFAFINEKVSMDRDARVKKLEAMFESTDPITLEKMGWDPTVEIEQED